MRFLMAVLCIAFVAGASAPSLRAAPILLGCAGQADGNPCDDGNGCTTGDACRSGVCLAPLSLAAPAPTSVGTQPTSVAVGDWNEDGRLDFAVTNGASANVTILLDNGVGGFSAASGSPVAVGTTPDSIVTADWNGDGHADLAVVNNNSNNVTILLGNGLGGFSPAAGSPVAVGTKPAFIASGDWNGDRKLDLAVVNATANNVTFLLGDGSGGFSPAPGSPVAVGTSPRSIATGDWNGDGATDLAIANFVSANITILLGNGSGGFSEAAGSPIAIGQGPLSLVAGDWDRDGKLDLATANISTGTTTILLGSGVGGFHEAAGSPFATGDHPNSVAAADWNGDGKLDLAFPNQSLNSLTVLLGTGTGSFIQAAGSPYGLAGLSGPVFVAPGDLNIDGRNDFVVVAQSLNDVQVFLNLTAVASIGTSCSDGDACTLSETCNAWACVAPASFAETASTATVGNQSQSLTVGDWNHDGKLDVAVTNWVTNDVSILLGDGSGGFTAAAGSPIGVSAGPLSIVTADFNGDGKPDLAVADNGFDQVTVLLGNGSGGFTSSLHDVPTHPVALTIGDWNGDGRPDIAVVISGVSSTVEIMVGDGTGGFSSGSSTPVRVNSIGVVAGDWNRDGKLDLAVVSQSLNNVQVLIGNGLGQFTTTGLVSVGSQAFVIVTGDWNGDGNPDLAVGATGSADVTSLLGNGSGGFHKAPGLPFHSPGLKPGTLVVGDWNADGKPDLASPGSGNIQLLIGTGAGNFVAGSSASIETGSFVVAAGDLNGDGKADLVALRTNIPSTVRTLLATTSFAPDGTSCDDANTCTGTDTCSLGYCAGALFPPAEVDTGVRLVKSGADAVVQWNLASCATASSVLRGLVSAFPVGPGGGEEVCLASGLAATTRALADSTVPPSNTAYWYLVRGSNAAGAGPYGYQSVNGVPIIPETSSTCP